MLLSLLSCSSDLKGTKPSFEVVSYNVQNLMDATLDGSEYDEYKPSASWTEKAYKQRLRTTAQVLCQRSIRSCDVILLQEVENAHVLKDLIEGYLAHYGFGYYASIKDGDSAISVSLISKDRPLKVAKCQVRGGRSVLEAVFDDGRDGRIVIYALHAKSQIGNKEEGEALRVETMRTVASCASDYPDSLILICGDFNEDPTAYRDERLFQTALIELDFPQTDSFMQKGSLAITGERGRVAPSIWYDPFLDSSLSFSQGGTCYFSGSWHCYDQILGNDKLFDMRGWEFGSFDILCDAFYLSNEGTPHAWNRQLLSGYSDHLPVKLKLFCY